jgi:hypothetical protein
MIIASSLQRVAFIDSEHSVPIDAWAEGLERSFDRLKTTVPGRVYQ